MQLNLKKDNKTKFQTGPDYYLTSGVGLYIYAQSRSNIIRNKAQIRDKNLSPRINYQQATVLLT